MIRFKCPGCLHLHTANSSFAGMTARCIHCGERMRIPTPTARLVSRPATEPDGDPADPDDSDFLLEPGEETDRGESTDAPGDDGPDTRGAKPGDDADASGPDGDEAAEGSGRSRAWVGWLAAAAAAVLVGGGGYFLYASKSGSKTPPTSASPAPTPAADPGPEPAATQDAPPPPPAPVSPPPPPEPVTVNAAALVAAFLHDAAETNRRYAGQTLLVRGTFGGMRYRSFDLMEGNDAVTVECGLPRGPDGHPRAAVLGAALTWGFMPPPPNYSRVPDGTPVTVRGVYQLGCRFSDATIVKTGSPADDKYAGRPVALAGVIESLNLAPETGPFPTVVLEPPSTEYATKVVCLFKPSDREGLSQLKVGQKVSLTGTCSGRLLHTIRIENCLLTMPGAPAVPAEKFFAEYEEDLLPGPPVDPIAAPVSVAATELAAAWATDPKSARTKYYRKRLAVTGLLLTRNPFDKTALFESATDQKLTVKLFMTPSRFAQLPEPDGTRTPITCLCTCSGEADRNVLRLDGGVWLPPPEDPSNLRVTADYFPVLPPGRVLTFDRVQYGPTGNTIHRFVVQFTPSQQIRLTHQLAGTFPGKSLFQEPPAKPKWVRDLKKTKGGPPEQTLMYRVEGKAIEVGQPAAATTGLQAGVRWEAVLLIGAKRGQSWTAEAPSGSKVAYTVTGFRTDPVHGPVVEVLRVATPTTPSAGTIEESMVTYAKGVGEVARVITQRLPNGTGRVISETKLVAPAPDAPKPTPAGAPPGVPPPDAPMPSDPK